MRAKMRLLSKVHLIGISLFAWIFLSFPLQAYETDFCDVLPWLSSLQEKLTSRPSAHKWIASSETCASQEIEEEVSPPRLVKHVKKVPECCDVLPWLAHSQKPSPLLTAESSLMLLKPVEVEGLLAVEDSYVIDLSGRAPVEDSYPSYSWPVESYDYFYVEEPYSYALDEAPCELYTPCCYYQSPCLNVVAEYLFWQAWPEATLYALDGTDIGSGQQGHPSFIKGKWASGMRFTAEHTFCADSDLAWNLGGSYTCLKTHSSHTRTRGSLLLRPTDLDLDYSSPGQGGAPAGEISNTWHISYQIADVTFAKWWYPCDCSAWTPYIGVRGAWIFNRFHNHVLYNDGRVPPPVTDDIKSIDSRDVGLIAGLNTLWEITPSWFFAAGGGMGILWANNHSTYTYSDNGQGVDPDYDNVDGSFSTYQMVFDFKVGIEYGRVADLCFLGSSYYGCRCSWEFHYWPEQGRTLKLVGLLQPQNSMMSLSALYLQGLTATIFLNW